MNMNKPCTSPEMQITPSLSDAARVGQVVVFFMVAIAGLVGTTRAAANSINDQVGALTEEKRQVIFSRMMQREGERCASVTRTFYQGSSSDGAAFWSISCQGGKDWQIMIKNTAQGDIKFLECSVMKALNAGQCFIKFKR